MASVRYSYQVKGEEEPRRSRVILEEGLQAEVVDLRNAIFEQEESVLQECGVTSTSAVKLVGKTGTLNEFLRLEDVQGDLGDPNYVTVVPAAWPDVEFNMPKVTEASGKRKAKEPKEQPWSRQVRKRQSHANMAKRDGNEQRKREDVYNTMFHVPWRCELLIDVGFFVCLDSFLTLFTVMPVRIVMLIHRLTTRWKQFQRPRADELSDVACWIVLLIGVTWLYQVDISLIYHLIRGTATIKLYVIYNVLEIFDKLCQSFGSDVLQVLFNSAFGVTNCSNENILREAVRFVFDQCIALVCFTIHSFIILSEAITVSAAINAQNNALLTMLISNNFAEIKSNVFKRLGKENLHKMAYHDTVERFHIVTHLSFVLAQNILGADGPWVYSFVVNAAKIIFCEVLIDVIKHSFLAKFNDIKPESYSVFLASLCTQTLSSQSKDIHKTMEFVPLAPACVVIRVMIPLFTRVQPGDDMFGRSVRLITQLVVTYSILVFVKRCLGVGLQKHAMWYIKRQSTKKVHNE